VYRDHVPKGRTPPRTGAFVRVQAGAFEAVALWDPVSPIALRIFSRERVPDAAWFNARVREALSLRGPLRAAGTTAFRLLNGEGDGVPGVVADVYERFVVLVTYADSLASVLPMLVAALERELAPEGIVLRERRSAGDSGDAESRLRLLSGQKPPSRLVVSENGMRLSANLEAGQKTGLFLDHRENRAFVRALAQGRECLNLFSYTGAFSVALALGGAKHVTSVDVATGALDAARENFALNRLAPEEHAFVAADVFRYLEAARAEGRRFDLVVCDPPSFAKSREHARAALRAYVRLNAQGLSVTRPGGLYAAASCTAQVSPEAFRDALAQAAARARVRFQIVHDAAQAIDHPVAVGHPEGRYLKFVLGRVLERA